MSQGTSYEQHTQGLVQLMHAFHISQVWQKDA